MKKSKLIIILLSLALLLVGCSNTKTYNSKEDVQAAVEEFFDGFLNEEVIKMESYYSDTLQSVFMKDNDKYYVNYPEAYDYYCFMLDGLKYTIADDRSVFQEDTTYDMTAETLNNFLLMNVTWYFEMDDETVSYSATSKGSEINYNIQGNSDGSDYSVNVTAKKENNKIFEVTSEIKYDDQVNVSKFLFTYGETIELPEYKMPKTYNNLPHVDSPYKTFGDAIYGHSEDDYFYYMFYDQELLLIVSKDNHFYQLSSVVDPEIINAYEELDFMEDDIEKKIYALIENIEVEDCVDFTNEILNEEQLNAYKGKKIIDLIHEGYEVSGYSFFDDTSVIYLNKDYMEYVFDVEVSEGFDPDSDFDYDAFNDFVVLSGRFDYVGTEALPMR